MSDSDGVCESDCNDCDGVIFGCDGYTNDEFPWEPVLIFSIIAGLIIYYKYFA